MNTNYPRILLAFAACLFSIGFTGCKTSEVAERPLTQAEIKDVLSRPKNPRSLYLTVYEGPAGPEFENAHRVHRNQFSELNLFHTKEQPGVIKVTGPNSPLLNVLLDPSTPESWAPVSMRYELPLTPLGPPYYQVDAAHLADVDAGFITLASAIKLDALFVDSVLVSIRDNAGDLGPFSRGTDPVADVVLGHQFMKAFAFIRLDYTDKKVSFSTSEEYPVPDRRLLAKLPLYIIEGALGTEAIINGKKTKVLLDLAGNYHFVDSQPNESQTLYLKDLSLRDLPVSTSGEQGLVDNKLPRIGWKALNTFIITLDYQRRVIWIERP